MVPVALAMAFEAEGAVGEIADRGEEEEHDREADHRVDMKIFRDRPIAGGDEQRDRKAGEGIAD